MAHARSQVSPYVKVLPMVQLLQQLLPLLQVPLPKSRSASSTSSSHDKVFTERPAGALPFHTESIGYAGAYVLERASRTLRFFNCKWLISFMRVATKPSQVLY